MAETGFKLQCLEEFLERPLKFRIESSWPFHGGGHHGPNTSNSSSTGLIHPPLLAQFSIEGHEVSVRRGPTISDSDSLD